MFVEKSWDVLDWGGIMDVRMHWMKSNLWNIIVSSLLSVCGSKNLNIVFLVKLFDF